MPNVTRVDRDLIAAAERFERQPHNVRYIRDGVPAYHLLDVVSDSLALGNEDGSYAERRQRYHNCAQRLFDCVGFDLADFTGEEVVDMLVAASYWRSR